MPEGHTLAADITTMAHATLRLAPACSTGPSIMRQHLSMTGQLPATCGSSGEQAAEHRLRLRRLRSLGRFADGAVVQREYGMTAKPSLGKIEVSQRAVATLVAGAVLSCHGVVDLAPRPLRDGFGGAFHRYQARRGIDVQAAADGLRIEVFVIVEYGVKLAEVGKNVAEAVRFAVQRSLSLPVKSVTINIQGLRISTGR